jgi:hypothetical protein
LNRSLTASDSNACLVVSCSITSISSWRLADD